MSLSRIKRFFFLCLIFVSSTGFGRSLHSLSSPDPHDSSLIENRFYRKYHALLDASPDFYSNYKLFHFIEKWIGTPYNFGGVSLFGVDCSALTRYFADELWGVKLPRTAQSQYNHLKKSLPPYPFQPGDLLFFHTTRPGISHVGIYLTNNKFFHASASKGVCIDDLEDPYYLSAFRAARRVSDKTYELKPEEWKAYDLRVLNISGRYRSDILIRLLGIQGELFHRLNPDFDKTVWTSFELRLPKSYMESFLLIKDQILEASVNSIMSF
jgi:hypothetical protein